MIYIYIYIYIYLDIYLYLYLSKYIYIYMKRLRKEYGFVAILRKGTYTWGIPTVTKAATCETVQLRDVLVSHGVTGCGGPS